MEPKAMDITSQRVLVNHFGHVINVIRKTANLVLDTGLVKIYGQHHHLKKQPAQRVGWQNLRGGNNAKTLRFTNEEEKAG